MIRDTENVWIVAYIDPACGECKKFAIEWERLRTVETIKYRRVKLGYVDITLEASRKVVGKYTAGKDVKYTPSVFIYGIDKKNPVEYKGELDASKLEKVACTVCDKPGSEKVIGTHGGLKVVGATKIQNKSVLGKSNYSLDVKDVPIKKSTSDSYYDDYNRGTGAWKSRDAGKADQYYGASGAKDYGAGGKRYRDAGAKAHGYADAHGAKAGYWGKGYGDYEGHDGDAYAHADGDAYGKSWSDGDSDSYGDDYSYRDGDYGAHGGYGKRGDSYGGDAYDW